MYKALKKAAVSANSDTMETVNHSKNGKNPERKSRNVFSMNKFLFIAFVLFSFSIVGCEKNHNDDLNPTDPTEGDSTTVEQDKANIRASFDRLKSLIENFKNGSFYQFADKFIDYRKVEKQDYYYNHVGDGNGNYSVDYETGEFIYTPGEGDYEKTSSFYYSGAVSEFVQLLGEKLADVIEFDDIEDNRRFNLSSFAGKYEWNKSSESWTESPNNAIIVLFPSDKNRATNDCEAAFNSYEDKKCNIEGNDIYLPVKADISFKQNNKLLFSAKIEADFTNYGVPKSVTSGIYVAPLQFNLALKQEDPKKFSAKVGVEDETTAENNLEIKSEVALSSDLTQYSDIDDMEVTVLKLEIKQHKLAITGTVDIKTLSNLENTAANINKHIDFKVSYNNRKIGSLKVVEEKDGNQYLYIVYNDGTQENTSIYYDKFIEDIKDIFKETLER
jgi:hypothetical protein